MSSNSYEVVGKQRLPRISSAATCMLDLEIVPSDAKGRVREVQDTQAIPMILAMDLRQISVAGIANDDELSAKVQHPGGSIAVQDPFFSDRPESKAPYAPRGSSRWRYISWGCMSNISLMSNSFRVTNPEDVKDENSGKLGVLKVEILRLYSRTQ
ncbi:hypothetical protein KC316_g1676 [Hortaea werneckii]|nr:hypothetical protein KC324_g1470 [Hortaea werneckii]KAI7593534.1 hypothetical protein KC316_g1676 [Hortaea werneckii]